MQCIANGGDIYTRRRACVREIDSGMRLELPHFDPSGFVGNVFGGSQLIMSKAGKEGRCC